MPIQFECPHCGRKLKAPDNAAGKSSNCPGCGRRVTAPEPIHDAEIVGHDSGDDMPEILDGPSPYSDLDDGTPYGVEGPADAPLPPERRKPCPVCGEMIIASAAKCRFCGEVFDPALRKAESKKRGKRASREDSELTTGEYAVAILCSGIGCIAGLIWMIQGKPKGGKMLGISLLFVVIWNVVRFAIETSLKH